MKQAHSVVKMYTHCTVTLATHNGRLTRMSISGSSRTHNENAGTYDRTDPHQLRRSSVDLLLCDLDECFRGPVEEQQLAEEILLDHQLSTLTHQVDVKAELQQEVGIRQLDEHDAERQALQPHADEATDDKHQRDVQSNHTEQVHIILIPVQIHRTVQSNHTVNRYTLYSYQYRYTVQFSPITL